MLFDFLSFQTQSSDASSGRKDFAAAVEHTPEAGVSPEAADPDDAQESGQTGFQIRPRKTGQRSRRGSEAGGQRLEAEIDGVGGRSGSNRIRNEAGPKREEEGEEVCRRSSRGTLEAVEGRRERHRKEEVEDQQRPLKVVL